MNRMSSQHKPKQKMGKNLQKWPLQSGWLQQNMAFTFQVLLKFRTRQNRKFEGVWATGEYLTSYPTVLAGFEVRETVRSVCLSMADLGRANTKLRVFGRRSELLFLLALFIVDTVVAVN